MRELAEDDYKYVLQEFSRTMIGARFTYGELLYEERVPFKFQTIIDRLIRPFADTDMRIGEHIFGLTPEDKNYRIYDNLNVRLRASIPCKDGSFKVRDLKLEELLELQDNEDIFVQEVVISNLALMGFKL